MVVEQSRMQALTQVATEAVKAAIMTVKEAEDQVKHCQIHPHIFPEQVA